MSVVGEATLVGAEVRPDAAEPMKGTGEPVCEKSHVRVWSAEAGEEVLPERVREELPEQVQMRMW